MNGLLVVAAALAFVVGAAHSYLGERYLLRRLFRRPDLPRLRGSDVFTKRTLRFAWHVTTVSWWGSAALLLAYARPRPPAPRTVLAILAGTFVASSIVTLVGSRGRHVAWVLFPAIALCAWIAAGA